MSERLVHLCARLPVGGMERVVALLYRHVPSDRYASQIWCLEDADVLGRELESQGALVRVIGKRPGRHPGLFLKLARLLRSERIDILHCHDELSWFYGTVAARLAGRAVRVLVTMHGRRPNISKRHLLEQRWLAAGTAHVVCVSDFLARQIADELKLASPTLQTIKNGVEVPIRAVSQGECREGRARLGLPAAAFVAGCVGELSPVKNLDLALSAAAIVRQSRSDFRFVFIGDGALRDQLKARAEALSLQGVVSFAGLRRDVPALLPALDVYVCSSNYEGISLSILEAMATGVPIIATSVGGNPELVRPGVSGELVAKGDVEAMAAALLTLADDAGRRRALGLGAQAIVRETHGIDQMVRAYQALYQDGRARPPSTMQTDAGAAGTASPGR